MKKRIFIPLFLCSLVMISSPSKSEEWMYWGWGAQSCADVIKDTKDNNGSYGLLEGLTVNMWIQGYITGRNIETGRTLTSNLDVNGILFELIKRCEAEPMSEISDELDWIYKNKMK